MEQRYADDMFYSWKRFGISILTCCVSLLVVFLILASIAAELDPYDTKILDNVSIGGLDVGGMTQEKAYRKLKEASRNILKVTDLSVELPEETLRLSPADTEVSLKLWRAVNAAYRIGRTGSDEEQLQAWELSQGKGHNIGLAPYLKLNKAYIHDALQNYALQYDTDCTPSSYQLTGNMPDLEIENQTENTVCQMLELTIGLPTARLNTEHAYSQILSVYDNAFGAIAAEDYAVRDFRVDILEEPEKPDLQSIYDTLYIQPVDDSLDMENYKVIPGAFGYHFDLENAEKLAAKAAFGETLSIPMELVEPEVYGEDVYFRDVLGYCETPHTKDENRNNNLRQACKAMDGLVLQPGEVFSYNDTLGPRTKERGYLPAGAYSGWELVQSYGGGICQGSSTIYCAALYADLEIVHRKNHGYAVSYIDYGLDATVNWGGPDFQFRNSTHLPIKIAAEVSDGYVKVTILGTEERDYYIKMESEAGWGDSYIYARSYKCKYDRETDELISRELEARSIYMR